MSSVITHLPILIVNVHSRCNCRCSMCDIWRTTSHEEFPLHRLQAHMESIKRLGVAWVVFSGGEPLMHSDLFALARLLRNSGIKVSVLSTGLLLPRFAQQIVNDVDEVIISLDGPEPIHDSIRRTAGCFDAIRRGIEELRHARPDFPIAARCTLQRANYSYVFETIAAARSLGFDSLSFLAADVSSTAFGRELVWPESRQESVRLAREDTDVLRAQIERLIESDDRFAIDSPKHLRRIVSHFRGHLGLEPFAAPRCNAPAVSAVLDWNGDLRPCFFHPVLGNANEGLDAALNSESAQAFRRDLDISANEVCKRCVCSLYRAA